MAGTEASDLQDSISQTDLSSMVMNLNSTLHKWSNTTAVWNNSDFIGFISNGVINNTKSLTNNTMPRRRGLTFDPEYHVTWLCFACAIILANTLVFFVFKSDKKLLKRTPANNLLLSLAVNDFLTGIASLLQVLPYLKQQVFLYGGLMRQYNIGLDVSITILSVNSVIHLCLLAAERYLSIFYALQFKGLVTTRRVRYFIISAWSISCIIAVVQFIWIWSKNHKILFYYTVIITVTFAFAPLILLAVAYVRMFLMCKKLIREAPDNLLARRNTVNKELKILFMYFMMYLVFIVLCVPFFSIRLALDLKMMIGLKMVLDVPNEVIETFVLARYLASGVNPFIYTLYKQDFRRTVRASFLFTFFCKHCHDTAQVPNGEGNETCTKEIFASFGTHLTTLKKAGSETGLVDMAPQTKPLLTKKDHVSTNGNHRLTVHQSTRL